MYLWRRLRRAHGRHGWHGRHSGMTNKNTNKKTTTQNKDKLHNIHINKQDTTISYSSLRTLPRLYSGISRIQFIHSSNHIPGSSNALRIAFSCFSDSSNRGMSKQYPLTVFLESPRHGRPDDDAHGPQKRTSEGI